MKLSKKLKALRKVEGLTQKKISGLLGITKNAYQNYELNKRKPKYDIIQKLCQQFPQYALWLMTDGVDISSIKNQSIEIDDRNVL